MLASQYYWGYPLTRPPLPPALRAGAVREVRQLTRLRFDRAPDTPSRKGLAAAVDQELAIGVPVLRGARVLVTASSWTTRAVDDALRATVERTIRESSFFDQGVGPYADSSRRFNLGLIAVYRDAGSRDHVFAAYGTGAVGNDHFAVHELLFDLDDGIPRLGQHVRYYFDFAGIEGLEGPAIVLLLPLVVASGVKAGLAELARWL